MTEETYRGFALHWIAAGYLAATSPQRDQLGMRPLYFRDRQDVERGVDKLLDGPGDRRVPA